MDQISCWNDLVLFSLISVDDSLCVDMVKSPFCNVHCRFFCGPNAKKSDALAKQQKKRPRAGEANESDSDDEDDEDFKVKKKKGKTPKTASGKKGKQSGETSESIRWSMKHIFILQICI